jgi:hypothetical protein
MSKDEPKPPQEIPPLIDDPHAPVFYVDGVVGGGPNGSTFNLTFARAQYDYSGGGVRQYNQVAMRLVIPIAGLREAGQFISQWLERLGAGGEAETAAPIPKANLNYVPLGCALMKEARPKPGSFQGGFGPGWAGMRRDPRL